MIAITMRRTSIRLPAGLCAQAKELADRQGISLAELARRGLEHMLRVYALDQKQRQPWTFPPALPLGSFVCASEYWRELANRSPHEHDARGGQVHGERSEA
jgi:hypothetical protein